MVAAKLQLHVETRKSRRVELVQMDVSQFQQCWQCWSVIQQLKLVAGVVELVNVVAVVLGGLLPEQRKLNPVKPLMHMEIWKSIIWKSMKVKLVKTEA